MNRRDITLLFVIGFAVPFAISRYQFLPGYMDADYYFAGGIQIATGKGFTEPYIWNYLSDPQGLPTPSHTYWMPLASVVSALGMWTASQTTYAAGRFPFILLSACVPALTATLAFDFSRNRIIALTAGFLSIFSAFYAPFMPVPDNYAIYMLFGAGFFLLIPRNQKWIPFALGMLAGLMTFARSDGLLWLGLAGVVVMMKTRVNQNSFSDRLKAVLSGGALAALGYLLIMGFWHYRNWTLFETFLTPGGGRLLWLTDYREIFIYPAESLTRASFMRAGLDHAVQIRIEALQTNLSTALFAQGAILLVPFVLIGLWQHRSDLRVKAGVMGWIITFLVMAVVFPYAGERGSFHHAGAAVQPLWWVAAAIGLDAVVCWAQARRRFTDVHAPALFHGTLVVLMMFFTAYLVNFRVVSSGWAQDDVIYAAVEEKLSDNGISPMDVVIVRNPPGYYVRTRRSAILLPYGDEPVVLEVAERYGARYLILEKSEALAGLSDLYDNPAGNPAFVYLGEVESARLFRIVVVP